MNKQELINATAEVTGLTKKDTEATVNAVLDVITEELVSGGEVSLIGFGKFETRQRAARVGHNPQTGEPLNIPETKAVGFKVGKALKDAVRNS